MSDDLDRDLQARFDRELAGVPPPPTWSLATRARSPRGVVVTVVVIAALLVGATAGGLALRASRESRSAALPSASPDTSPIWGTTASPSPTPTTGPTGGLVTHENAVLGYRIGLPETYRRSLARIEPGQQGSGVDLYTQQTEREAREQCQRDSGDVGSQLSDRDPDLRIGVAPNPGGISAVEWVTTPRAPGAQPLSTHQRVEPITIGGHEAVRLIADNATALTTAFVIRANDRMYELDAIQGLRSQRTWLDDIAKTFVAIPPTPIPTPTPTAAPRVAARGLADALAQAFKDRDADAVARLMPTCWINVYPLIDGQPPGGVLYRSVALFAQGLRDRFASGDLTVTVDPTLQARPEGGSEQFVVRSDWREPDRTTRIDLDLTELDGRWTWSTAVHHYTRAELLPGNCVPYRSPWVAPNGHC